MKPRRIAFAGTGGIAALVSALALAPGATAGPTALAAASCTPVSNIEAIIDDSGSMLSTDPNQLRRGGLELFMALPANNARTFGAVEFGSLADTVFAPTQILSTTRPTLVAALRAKTAGDGAYAPTASGVDDGAGTDYNDAFARATADDPAATARIFLTDGAHNENEYANLHRGGPRTFVIGLGIDAPSPANPDATRLQLIADETGGRYFPNLQQAGVQAVFNEITQLLSCSPPPKTIPMPDFFTTRQHVTRTFKPTLSAKRTTFVVNWAQTGNRFGFSRLKALNQRGKVLATLTGKGKPKKLRISRQQADTFTSLTIRRVAGLRRYKFTVAASQLSTGESPIVQATNLK